MTLTRKFHVDKCTFDADAKVSENAEYLTVDPVTFIREGVYPYDDGKAYKPGSELAAAVESSGDLRILWDHPQERVVTSHTQVKGFASGIHAEKDNHGVKIKGVMRFYKKTMTADQIELIRSKLRRDVSLAFYYTEDRTPGSWNGQRYDYKQQDFLFDHVASVDHGRCPYPMCGIGVDAGKVETPMDVKIGTDPYPNEHSCRLKDPGDFQANSFRRIKRGRVSIIIARLKGKTTTSAQAIRYPKARWSAEAARSDCKSKGGSFEAATGDTGPTGADLDNRLAPDDVNYRAATPEGDNCGECVFFRYQVNECQIIEGQVSANMVCDEYTGRPTLQDIVHSVQGAGDDVLEITDADQDLPASSYAYVSPQGEKKLPINTPERVRAALNAVQNWSFRGNPLDIPTSAKAEVKAKVCRAAKRFDIKSPLCGTADAGLRADELGKFVREIRNLDREKLVDLHRRMHATRSTEETNDQATHKALVRELTRRRRDA